MLYKLHFGKYPSFDKPTDSLNQMLHKIAKWKPQTDPELERPDKVGKVIIGMAAHNPDSRWDVDRSIREVKKMALDVAVDDIQREQSESGHSKRSKWREGKKCESASGMKEFSGSEVGGTKKGCERRCAEIACTVLGSRYCCEWDGNHGGKCTVSKSATKSTKQLPDSEKGTGMNRLVNGRRKLATIIKSKAAFCKTFASANVVMARVAGYDNDPIQEGSRISPPSCLTVGLAGGGGLDAHVFD